MGAPTNKNKKRQRTRHCILSQHHREGHITAQRGLPRNRAPSHGGAHAQRARKSGLGPNKHKAFWEWLWEKIVLHKVQVLMGDFNMSLFKVIPELRSRGAVIDFGAWYPWMSLGGRTISDSCGILFVNMPGVYTLNSLGDLHARDATGVLACAEPVETNTDSEDGNENRRLRLRR